MGHHDNWLKEEALDGIDDVIPRVEGDDEAKNLQHLCPSLCRNGRASGVFVQRALGFVEGQHHGHKGQDVDVVCASEEHLAELKPFCSVHPCPLVHPGGWDVEASHLGGYSTHNSHEHQVQHIPVFTDPSECPLEVECEVQDPDACHEGTHIEGELPHAHRKIPRYLACDSNDLKDQVHQQSLHENTRDQAHTVTAGVDLHLEGDERQHLQQDVRKKTAQRVIEGVLGGMLVCQETHCC
mmetsp:Transcript_34477/g.75242  ORF Transcript_34477/g.75242 Transcript_34477/m.75242 type:complete len:239 (+) Transcript_34477:209-925(+)